MERLKQVFNARFDINVMDLTKEQQDLVVTVWAEHFDKIKPINVCLGTFRNICRSLYSEYNIYVAGQESLASKLKSVEKVEIIKPVKKKNNKNKKKKRK